MEVKDDAEFGVRSSNDYGHHFYKSPEVMKNSWITQKSDIYSLGVLLFGLLYPSETEARRIEKLNELHKSLTFLNDWKYPNLMTSIRSRYFQSSGKVRLLCNSFSFSILLASVSLGYNSLNSKTPRL